MSLHIVIGFDGPGNGAKATLVYLGRSGSDAAAAREADTSSVRFEIFANSTGLRKNNPRAGGVANATAAEAARVAAAKHTPPRRR